MVRSREGLRPGNGDMGENLKQSLYEVRFADPESDAIAVSNLFSQPSVIEHLAGIAPKDTPPGVDVKKYGIKNPAFNILRASPDEIKQYYKDRGDRLDKDGKFIHGLKLLVALDNKSNVVGTITVEPPSGPGLTFGGVSRIAVSEEVRGEGIGRKLLKAANAYLFSKPKDGGLGCTASQVGIITGIAGDEKPSKLFQSEGYRVQSDSSDNCVSWDSEKKLFVSRRVWILRLEVKDLNPKFSARDLPRDYQQ